jgi:hypothetical protein
MELSFQPVIPDSHTRPQKRESPAGVPRQKMMIWLRTRWAGFPGSVLGLQSAIASLKAKDKANQLKSSRTFGFVWLRHCLGSFALRTTRVRSIEAALALIRFPRRSGSFGFRDASPPSSPGNATWEF